MLSALHDQACPILFACVFTLHSKRPNSTSHLTLIRHRHAVSLTDLRADGHQRTMIETPPRPKTRSTTQLQRLLALGGSITPTRSRKARGTSTVPGTPGNSIVISRS